MFLPNMIHSLLFVKLMHMSYNICFFKLGCSRFFGGETSLSLAERQQALDFKRSAGWAVWVVGCPHLGGKKKPLNSD